MGCGFVLTEARGAIGRIFEDLPSGGRGEPFTRSFREALIDPRISTHNHHRHGDDNQGDEQSMAPTPPTMPSAHHDTGSSRPLRPRYNSANARESALSGLISSSKHAQLQAARDGEGAAVTATPGRDVQFHVCLQALHVFWQEHGHLPVVLDRDQADEIVRIADELIETGKQVGPEDLGLCLLHLAVPPKNQGFLRFFGCKRYPPMFQGQTQHGAGCKEPLVDCQWGSRTPSEQPPPGELRVDSPPDAIDAFTFRCN